MYIQPLKYNLVGSYPKTGPSLWIISHGKYHNFPSIMLFLFKGSPNIISEKANLCDSTILSRPSWLSEILVMLVKSGWVCYCYDYLIIWQFCYWSYQYFYQEGLIIATSEWSFVGEWIWERKYSWIGDGWRGLHVMCCWSRMQMQRWTCQAESQAWGKGLHKKNMAP